MLIRAGVPLNILYNSIGCSEEDDDAFFVNNYMEMYIIIRTNDTDDPYIRLLISYPSTLNPESTLLDDVMCAFQFHQRPLYGVSYLAAEVMEKMVDDGDVEVDDNIYEMCRSYQEQETQG